MRALVCSLVLATLCCMAAEPIIRYDFSLAKGGVIPNLGTKGEYSGKLVGKCEIQDGALLMDGRTTKITVNGTEDFDVSRNYTFMLLYRRADLPADDKPNQSMDAFFTKRGVFVMTKHNNFFYANGKMDGKWSISGRAPDVFTQADMEWHHIAMSLEYKLNWNDAEEWVEYNFYKDGVRCGKFRIKDVRLDKAETPLEIGFNSAMGPLWNLGGEIADARVYEGVLSEAEIQKIILSQNRAKPAFKLEYQLSEEEERQLAGLAPELQSAIRNLASLDDGRLDWRSFVPRASSVFQVLEGRESCLVLLNDDGYAGVCSWYDRRANREMLKGDNAFASWTVEHWQPLKDGTLKGGRLEAIGPFDRRVASSLKEPPRRDAEGAWRFGIQYDCASPGLTALTRFAFKGDRLEFSHTARSLEAGTTLHSVSYPKCSLRELGGGGEALVVPEGSGVVYARPCENNARYSSSYPRSFCSMQFCAYYDQVGGLVIATQDPWARRKEMLFIGAQGRMDGSITWRVPYDAPGGPNEFDTGTPAVMELFRGDWFDAGMLYRRDVAAMKADWWSPELPRRTSRRDVMENCIWVHSNYEGRIPDELFRLRDYLGMDFYVGDVWHWWEKGVMVHLAPTMRTSPEWMEFVKVLKGHGLSTMAYMDGRLWAEKDRRGEDWMYSGFGHRMNIVSDGVPVREMYKVPCDTVCPATPEYQEHFFEFINRISMQGLNGLYIDQLGASFPPPCHVASHGHRYADWFTSYRDGYARLLRRLRAHWAERGKEMALSTEDAVEQFCSLLDFFQPYRWTYDNQVPLFPLVYSGRIQFYNRETTSTAARFQSTAEQLLNSEQPGIFRSTELVCHGNGDIRRYAKRLAWTRHALLEVFNGGQLARPPEMLREMPRIRRFWSRFGTRFVTKPQVQSAAWEYGDARVVILINTEATPHTNIVRFGLPAERCEYEMLSCEAPVSTGKAHGKCAELEFSLGPRMPMLVVAYPEGRRPDALMARIMADFATVRGTLSEPDLFGKHDWPETEPIDATAGANLADAAYVQNCRANKELGRVDCISYATIYPGVVDFGETPKRELVLEIACGLLWGGEIKVYLDTLEERPCAELDIDMNFKKTDWNAYEERRALFRQPVSGKHKLILCVLGRNVCNLRNWRAE